MIQKLLSTDSRISVYSENGSKCNGDLNPEIHSFVMLQLFRCGFSQQRSCITLIAAGANRQNSAPKNTGRLPHFEEYP